MRLHNSRPRRQSPQLAYTLSAVRAREDDITCFTIVPWILYASPVSPRQTAPFRSLFLSPSSSCYSPGGFFSAIRAPEFFFVQPGSPQRASRDIGVCRCPRDEISSAREYLPLLQSPRGITSIASSSGPPLYMKNLYLSCV